MIFHLPNRTQARRLTKSYVRKLLQMRQQYRPRPVLVVNIPPAIRKDLH